MAAQEDERRDAEAPEGGTAHQCVEWCPICRTMDILRASSTPEIREQWEAVQREALLTLRTLVEHYIQRVGEQRAGPEHRSEASRRATPVEEIPVE
jgi:hypothetical protein